jgi:hypothetical protein
LTTAWTRSDYPGALRQQIDVQRPKVAAAQVDDVRGREAIADSFVAGFRAVAWIAALVALTSSLSAGALIKDDVSGALLGADKPV